MRLHAVTCTDPDAENELTRLSDAPAEHTHAVELRPQSDIDRSAETVATIRSGYGESRSSTRRLVVDPLCRASTTVLSAGSYGLRL